MKAIKEGILLLFIAFVIGVSAVSCSPTAFALDSDVVMVAENNHKLPPIEDSKKQENGSLKNIYNDMKILSEEGVNKGSEIAKPLMVVVSYLVSAAIYFIFVFSLVLIIPDLLYMQFPFLRRVLGGPDGASADGANSPMGYSGGYNNGMYGNNISNNSIDPKKNRLGGLVSDDAKRIVKDQTISHKFGHYIVAKVLNFLALGVCSVVLLSSVWFGYGFWIGEMVLKGVKYVFQMFGA